MSVSATIGIPEYLYSWQKTSLVRILKSSLANEGKWFVIKSFRQNSGKTFLIMHLMLMVALGKKGSTSVLLEPTNAQGDKVFTDLVDAGRPYIARANSSSHILQFKNGSRLLVKSAESGDSLRGYSVKRGGVLAIDEGGYVGDDVYEIILPIVNKAKATLVVASTPDRQAGMFYKLYSMGLDKAENNRVVSINWSKYIHDAFSQEDLDFYRSIYSSRRYRTEILGEFVQNEGSVFKKLDLAVRPKGQLTGKVDLVSIDWGSGQGKDYTAVCYWNEQKELIKIDYFNELSPVEQIDRLRQRIEEDRPRKVIVEQNSIGAVYLDMLRKELGGLVRVEGFQTDNKSKNRIIDSLAAGFEHELIHMPEDEELLHELRSYEEQTTRTGLRTYNAQAGCHDDLVMAMAIGWDELNSRNNYSGFRIV